MRDWFVWKGVKSTSLGIRALTLPDITIPEERVEFVDIAGRSDSVKVVENANRPVYSDIVLSVTCVVDDVNAIDIMAPYLSGTSEVTFANRPDVYYKATIVNQIPFGAIVRGDAHRSFTVNFRCKARPFVHDKTSYSYGGVNSTIYNPYNTYSEPLFIITPTQDPVNADVQIGGSFGIGGLYVGYNIPKDNRMTLYVDCETEEAYYYEDGVLKNGNEYLSTLDHIIIKPGSNTVLAGNNKYAKITLIPRWRKLA